MKKSYLTLLLLVLTSTSSYSINEGLENLRMGFYDLFLCPEIGFSNEFINNNQMYLNYGFGYQYTRLGTGGLSPIQKFINADMKCLSVSLPINKLNSTYHKLINYNLLQVKLQDYIIAQLYPETHFDLDYSLNLLSREKNIQTGINEINYLNFGFRTNYIFLTKYDFQFITGGLEAKVGASQYEVDDIENNQRKSFYGLDWGLNANFVVKNKFCGLEALASIRNVDSLWIYSLQASLHYDLMKAWRYTSRADGPDEYYDLIYVGLTFNRSRYRFKYNERYINTLKLNLNVNLWGLMFPHERVR